MAAPNQIVGGLFQDINGNPLANGSIVFELNQDSQVNGNVQICSGYKITVLLGSNGSVAAPAFLWTNDLITPSGSFYMISAYTAAGQLIYGPSANRILSSPSPFDLGTLTPTS